MEINSLQEDIKVKESSMLSDEKEDKSSETPCHDSECDHFISNKPQLRDRKEEEHLERVCDSFRQYATFTRCTRAGQMARISNLPPSQQKFFPRSMIFGSEEAKAREDIMQEAELRNQFFFDCLLRHAGLPHSQDVMKSSQNSSMNAARVKKKDIYISESQIQWTTDETIEKVHSVLKSVARDWSKEGATERAMAYMPLMDGMNKYVPLSDEKIVRVLVPGAGVGRLALELFSLGYEVQGNEFSLHMLLASDFILNGCTADKPYAISPWITSSRNVCRSDDPARKVYVPDIDHTQASTMDLDNKTPELQPDFSMAAGEFVSIYSKPDQKGKWNAVVSCFFLDTAPCIVEYLEVMWHLLEDDGMLINFGPLHYHWSGPPFRPDDISFANYKLKNSHLDDRYLHSVDMTWEDIREVLWRVGFEVLEERLGVKSRYTADTRNFLNSDYRCIYFVAKKGTPKPHVDEDEQNTQTAD